MTLVPVDPEPASHQPEWEERQIEGVSLEGQSCFRKGRKELSCLRDATGYAGGTIEADGINPPERVLVFFCSVVQHEESGKEEAERLMQEALVRRRRNREADAAERERRRRERGPAETVDDQPEPTHPDDLLAEIDAALADNEALGIS